MVGSVPVLLVYSRHFVESGDIMFTVRASRVAVRGECTPETYTLTAGKRLQFRRPGRVGLVEYRKKQVNPGVSRG
jgi:ferric-dicitrate binding protein FerR (iron transport regulator)